MSRQPHLLSLQLHIPTHSLLPFLPPLPPSHSPTHPPTHSMPRCRRGASCTACQRWPCSCSAPIPRQRSCTQLTGYWQRTGRTSSRLAECLCPSSSPDQRPRLPCCKHARPLLSRCVRSCVFSSLGLGFGVLVLSGWARTCVLPCCQLLCFSVVDMCACICTCVSRACVSVFSW